MKKNIDARLETWEITLKDHSGFSPYNSPAINRSYHLAIFKGGSIHEALIKFCKDEFEEAYRYFSWGDLSYIWQEGYGDKYIIHTQCIRNPFQILVWEVREIL